MFILWKFKKSMQKSIFPQKNSKQFVYYNEELVHKFRFRTQLSRKLQRFRTCRKNKKVSIFHNLSEYRKYSKISPVSKISPPFIISNEDEHNGYVSDKSIEFWLYFRFFKFSYANKSHFQFFNHNLLQGMAKKREFCQFLRSFFEKNFFLKLFFKNGLYGGNFMREIDSAHSRILKMLPWPWFRGWGGCIEAKIKHFRIFMRKPSILRFF